MVAVGETHVRGQVHSHYALRTTRLARQRNHLCSLPCVAAGNQKIAAQIHASFSKGAEQSAAKFPHWDTSESIPKWFGSYLLVFSPRLQLERQSVDRSQDVDD